MSTNKRNVKGYIFKDKRDGWYYLAHKKGYTCFKSAAYVYSCEEVLARVQGSSCWGGKHTGKWIVVYE